MIKIPIIPIKLENQNPTEIQECFIELYPTYLLYQIRFFADEPVDENDKSLGVQSVFNSFKTIALKKNVAGIEKQFTQSKRWAVYIMISGFAGDIKVFFKKESEADEFFEKIEKWLLQ